MSAFRCIECGSLLEKNYDHVGNCEDGSCSGTFAHPDGRRISARALLCSMRFKIAPHRKVRPDGGTA